MSDQNDSDQNDSDQNDSNDETYQADFPIVQAQLDTHDPAGKLVKMFLFFLADGNFSSAAMDMFFDQNKSNFGNQPLGMKEIFRFPNFAAYDAYVCERAIKKWNGRDIYWSPPIVLPKVNLQ